jgi:hypothetical protein
MAVRYKLLDERDMGSYEAQQEALRKLETAELSDADRKATAAAGPVPGERSCGRSQRRLKRELNS